jgi:dipeptidyl aminopeptidase/acylaminoacyl peptidase
LCFIFLVSSVAPARLFAEDNYVRKANYDLAARWTSQKVGKLVFDTAVTPRWLETGDRFWYVYETNQGRRFYLVDPARKSKAPLFDLAKMAAMLTNLTRIPYDAQHLPIRTVKFVKKDAAFQFEVQVPRDTDIPTAKDVPEDQDDQEAQQQRRQGQAGAGDAESRTKTLGFEYELATGKLTMLPDYQPPKRLRWASLSPDEKTVIFARGQNLFMMDAENHAKALKKEDDSTIVETQITTDGEEHYGYARRLNDEDRRELKISDKDLEKKPRVPAVPISWSKDSKKFSLTRQDNRKVADLWVINSLANPRPTLETYRYPMPGEVNVTQAEMEVFDRDTKARVKVKTDRFKDQTLQVQTARVTNLQREREQMASQWVSDTSDKLYFTRTSRDMHKVDVCVANTETGEVKTLIEERMNTYIDSKPIRLIGNGQEIIHWSERDGWGHFYLYDGNGKLKNQITSGEFYADEIAGIDEKNRVLYLTANGREAGEDPYYEHLYRVNFDGSGMQMLTPGDTMHAISMSDSAKYFVNNFSKVNTAPKSLLYDAQCGAKPVVDVPVKGKPAAKPASDNGNGNGNGNGECAPLMDLETTDVTALLEAGFKYPDPFKVKADDGVTDLYGVMYKPFDFDPNKKYPIIAFVYPGPQTESVTKTFSPRNANVALAQFGFIVIEVGNRGGHPQRSKWYHTFGYGNLRDYGLADKKAAIEQLAKRHPFIDINRVGIYGHSGGGFMSTAAMLVYPDFFKVAVSSSGNHDNNVYNRSWSEKHHGVKEVSDKDGNVKFEYNIEKNSEIAKNLKGRLLLVTGDMDDNVHMAGTLRVADALIKANKRFDMLVIPGKRHGYADAGDYFFWVRADYFSKHLLGEVPDSVDMIELNREREQSGDRRPRP